LRIREGGLTREQLSPQLLETHAAVRQLVPELGEDRALEGELRELLRQVRAGAFQVYPGDAAP
jgi:hypothetical protein